MYYWRIKIKYRKHEYCRCNKIKTSNFQGKIPNGLPQFDWPEFSHNDESLLDMIVVMGTGIIVTPFISILENISLCRTFGECIWFSKAIRITSGWRSRAGKIVENLWKIYRIKNNEKCGEKKNHHHLKRLSTYGGGSMEVVWPAVNAGEIGLFLHSGRTWMFRKINVNRL